MEIIKWANGKGLTIQLDRDEAKELKFLIDKALIRSEAESDWIDPATRIEII